MSVAETSSSRIIPFQLTDEDKKTTEKILKAGKQRVRVIIRILILYKWEEKRTGPLISRLLPTSLRTVYRIRWEYEQNGLQYILNDRPRSGRPKNITYTHESQLTALACSPPPTGRARWTIRLLLEHLRTEFEWSGSRSMVWLCLIRHGLQPWRKRMWCLSTLSPTFIASMMRVLEVYERPYDPKRPVICLDEKRYQIIGDLQPAQPMTPHHEYREDHQYHRLGVMNFFVCVEPLRGRRIILATRQRTGREFALVIQHLLELYPEAEKPHFVVDNLSTHTTKALRDHFPPETAEKLLKRIIWVYTPRHASWLNMAENEVSVFQRQCLDRRFASETELLSEVQCWIDTRNVQGTPINWTFTRTRAREKFKLTSFRVNPSSDSSQDILPSSLIPSPLPSTPVDRFLTPLKDDSQDSSSKKNALSPVKKTKSCPPSAHCDRSLLEAALPKQLATAVISLPQRQWTTALAILCFLWQHLGTYHAQKTIALATERSKTTIFLYTKRLQVHGLVTLTHDPTHRRGRPPWLVALVWPLPN